MSKTGKTAQEFIQNSFSPLIAVLCSPKVENIVSKNNVSFTELLEPFTTMEWEGQFREPGGTVCIIKNWKLIFRDVNWKPLPPTEARKQLNNAVLYNYNDKTSMIELEGRKLDIPQSTPWFDAWRETYLEVQFPSDHEYTKHFLSCILVGTTLDENILETFNNMNQQYAQLQNVTPPKLPKWFNNSVLKSYLILHDVSSVPAERADAALETLKQNFGANNCFMLSINSKTTVDPSLPTDYWAPYIKRTSDINTDNISVSQLNMQMSPLEPQPTFALPGDENIMMASTLTQQEGTHPLTAMENDVYDNANSLQTHSFSGSVESVNVISKISDFSTEVHGGGLNIADIIAIKKFLQEYGSKALLPYLEKQISQLSEVVANRKGVSRSLLSATKRWFGTGKAGNTTASNAVIYSNDCPELQLRRLGDLWFMCGQWQRAFDAYHTAKREFYADSAWLCYAGALEMAAISAFMAGEGNRKTNAYMEESIVTYLTTCRMVQYAVRATLLSVLCLSSVSHHGEAAKQLIRMTSEDSDLRSAMLLEQAALCFLSGPGTKGMCRKYAFHMVLAGHRFSKAGQKKHAYRCYKQAYQVYNSSGWRLATDHVQFALGRLAGALKNALDAAKWLSEPLAPNSRQPRHQQDAFLREYMLAHQQLMETSEEYRDKLPLLPLPLLDHHSTTVLCVGPAPLSSPGRQPATSITLQDSPATDGQCWAKLEEMLLQVAQGSVPMIFKPTIDLYTEKTDNNPVVPQGEPIQIAISLKNPMNISLILKDVELLWHFTPSGEEPDSPRETVGNEASVATESTLENNVIHSQKIKSVLLEEDCNKVVLFSITPLRVGELTIQGVAYKLINAGEAGTENGNSVTISGKLNLSSPKNNEKRLKINVIPHAPCLQMTFSETSPEAISGEMRSIEVEFRNVGPVDMRNVHIAVSHPDCVSLVTGEQVGDDLRTLYDDKYRDLPKDSDERAERARIWRETASRHVSTAAPLIPRGGFVRARLYLRPKASLPAVQLLAYYEPVTSSPRPYRLLRHVFRFTVVDSVEISVVPRRSIRTINNEISENMNLVVEVKNVSKDKDDNITVELLQVSLLSRQWKLSDVSAARTEGPLKSRERLHIVFKSRRILEQLPEGHIEASSLKVVDTIQNEEDVNVPPYSKFLTDYVSNFESKDTLPQERSTGLIQSMFVVRWKVNNKMKKTATIGQHCLWLDCFSKTQSLAKQGISTDSLPLQIDEIETNFLEDKTKIKKDNVVIFKLEYSTNVNHDFNDSKLCLVPIIINIVNCYGVPVKVFIDMTKRKNRDTYSELGWAGALSGGLDAEGKELGLSLSLDKFESRKLNVKAICAAPGTYLLGSAFTLTTTRADDNNPVSHLNNNTSLLVVRQQA